MPFYPFETVFLHCTQNDCHALTKLYRFCTVMIGMMLWDITVFLLPAVSWGAEQEVRHWKDASGKEIAVGRWDTENDIEAESIQVLTDSGAKKVLFAELCPIDQNLVNNVRIRLNRAAEPSEPVTKSDLTPLVQTGHSDVINDVYLSADSRYMLTDNFYNSILWDIKNRIKVADYPGRSVLSPQGHFVCCKKVPKINQYEVVIVDVQTNKVVTSFVGDGDPVQTCIFSPDDKYLITGHGNFPTGNDPTIRIWDVEKGELIQELFGHEEHVSVFAFSHSGKIFASGDWAGNCFLWDWETKKIISSHDLHKQTKFKSLRALAFRPDDEELASCSIGCIRTFNLREQTTKVVIDHSGDQISYDPLNSEGIWCDGVLYSTRTGEEIKSLPPLHNGTINSMVLSKDQKTMVTGSSDRTAVLWKVGDEMEFVHRFGRPSSYISDYFAVLDTTGKFALCGSQSGHLIFFDTQTGSQRWSKQVHRSKIRAIALTSDNQQVLTAAKDGTLVMCDAHTGQIIRSFEKQETEFYALAVSPDKRTVFAGGYDKDSDDSLVVYDFESGKVLRKEDHSNVYGLAVSPDSQTVAVAGMDGVALLDSRTGEKREKLTKENATSVAFSPDGSLLIAGLDGDDTRGITAVVWNTRSGSEKFRLANPRTDGYKNVECVAVLPDGSFLVEDNKSIDL